MDTLYSYVGVYMAVNYNNIYIYIFILYTHATFMLKIIHYFILYIRSSIILL